MGDLIVTGILMGLGGTIAMDVWAQLLARTGYAAAPNWAMPGRWVTGALKGNVFAGDIGQVPPVDRELAIGWVFHYAVGIAYGVIFLGLAGAAWLAEPGFLPLWLFSLATIAAGWFLLQPGMGLGWAASRTPQPWKSRFLGLVAHTAFALGMWVVVMAVS